jgi:RNA polymerase sigma factor (sigma-70 family)
MVRDAQWLTLRRSEPCTADLISDLIDKSVAAFRHRYKWLPDEDLARSDAALAIMGAMERWDPEGGRTLDNWCIQRGIGAILDGFRTRSGDNRRVRNYRQVSLDVLTEDQEGYHTLQPRSLSAEHAMAAVENRDLVHRLLNMVGAREQLVLTRLYLDGRNGQEVANELAVTISRVSQLKHDALHKIRTRYRHEMRNEAA